MTLWHGSCLCSIPFAKLNLIPLLQTNVLPTNERIVERISISCDEWSTPVHLMQNNNGNTPNIKTSQQKMINKDYYNNLVTSIAPKYKAKGTKPKLSSCQHRKDQSFKTRDILLWITNLKMIQFKLRLKLQKWQSRTSKYRI